MKLLVLAHIFSFIFYVVAWSSLYSQHRSEPGNRALGFFFLNMMLWVLIKLVLYFPSVAGYEMFMIQAAAIFWLPSTFWFLNFVYRELNRKIDWIYVLNALIVVVALVFYYTTDLVVCGFDRVNMITIDLRGPYYKEFIAIPGVNGIIGLWLLNSGRRRIQDFRTRQSLRILLTGGLFSLFLGLIVGGGALPRLGACSAMVMVPFLLHAMRKYGYMSIQVENLARELFEEVHDGIILLDKGDRIIRINPAARKILSIEDEIDGTMGACDILPGYDSYAGSDNVEVAIKKGDDTTLNLIFSQSHTTREGGSINKIVLVKDISDEKQALDILRRSQEELEDEIGQRLQEIKHVHPLETVGIMAGGIAHDFNNLLAAIIGFSTAARDDLDDNQTVCKDLDEVLIAARQAREIVSQLLSFSRPQESHKELIEVRQLLNESLLLVESSLPANIVINRHFSDDEIWIMGDPDQLHQVIMNLCTNSYQAMMDEGGELNVSVSASGIPIPSDVGLHGVISSDTVQITVSDTGTGIPDDKVEKIFDPFYTTREPAEGSGLGLATVSRIIKEHAGTIKVESSPDKGTTILIMFPRIDDMELVGKDSNSMIITGGEHVMWIGKDEISIKIGRRFLAAQGYRTTGFSNPHSAVETFRKTPSAFDVIICELNMQEMTGVDISAEMISERPKIPIILVSSSFSQTEENAAKAAGVRGFVTKPLSKQNLGSAIRKVLLK